MMLRIEAGLALIDVEFTSARYAFTDAERFTPKELGFGWMLGKAAPRWARTAPFIGRRAIERELRDGTSRWATVGLVVDWEELRAAPPRARPGRAQGREPACAWESMLLRRAPTATSASATPPA